MGGDAWYPEITSREEEGCDPDGKMWLTSFLENVIDGLECEHRREMLPLDKNGSFYNVWHPNHTEYLIKYIFLRKRGAFYIPNKLCITLGFKYFTCLYRVLLFCENIFYRIFPEFNIIFIIWDLYNFMII